VRRALTGALLGVLVVLAVLAGGPGPAWAGPAGPVEPVAPVGSAQDGGDGSPPTTADEPDAQVPEEGIIPEPDSGRPPEEAGDRGGALQLAVLVLIVAGVGVIAAQVVRQARRQRGTAAR
jgi:hypothetical protein